jgi:hypothetical protein
MGKVINYNQSRVKQFRRCQKQYAFRYDYPELFGGTVGQEMVPVQKKLPLYRGSWMHALQEGLHHQWAGVKKFKIQFGEGRNALKIKGKTWEDVHEALSEQFNGMFEEEQDLLGDLPSECERLFRAYLRYWKEDEAKYKVAIIDGKPAIEYIMSCRLPNVRGANFKGKLDLLVEDIEYGGLWNWDAKWVKTVPAPDERMMSPQATQYVWALREQGLDIRGFVYNYGRTKPPAIPQVLVRGTLSLRKNMDTDLATYVAAMKRLHGKEWKKFIPYYRTKLNELKGREALWFRRERIPVEPERIERGLLEYEATVRNIQTRDKEDTPRSYFYNCKFSCDYHDVCCAEFQGLDITPLVKANYQFTGERYSGEEDLLKD